MAGIDSVRGVETFRLRFRLQGKTVFYSLDDVLESYVATDGFESRRFVQDFMENDKPKHRSFEIFPDSGFYRESGKDTTFASPEDPLDDAAFFYFVRITPLEVGKKYVFDRYFRKEKNPVIIEVVKREKMELPDGSKVQCLVLHPVIDTKGLFSKRSDTRIWLTDDERRLPVQIRTKFPFGTITLRLKNMVLPGSGAPAGRLSVAYREADLGRVRTVPVATRRNKVEPSLLAAPPGGDRSFAAFLDGLPDVLAARDLRAVIAGVARAARARRGVVLLLGGHVIKVGLGPLVAAWLRRGIVTHVALNGAAAIHDFELAAFGGTSEDVESGLADGTFGMAEETGAEMNAAIVAAAAGGARDGRRAGPCARATSGAARARCSVLLAALEADVPVTVHAAIGAEIIHQHPAADGAALGATSHRDFRRLAGSLPLLDRGGAVLNLGSAVLLPEVFLKALTVARNLRRRAFQLISSPPTSTCSATTGRA